jgi:alpha-ribazole phosphatase
MSELLFIRHAETEMAGTFCGHSNPGLNARGFAQLPPLVGRLEEENIQAVYTSDLLRARTTASAIADAFDISCQVRPALREINFGEWEGLTWMEIEQRDKDYARRWITDYPQLSAPWGETLRQFKKRVLDEVAYLSQAARGRNVAVITHAGVMRTVLGTLQGYSEEEAWRRTSSYCCIERHRIGVLSADLTLLVRS